MASSGFAATAPRYARLVSPYDSRTSQHLGGAPDLMDVEDAAGLLAVSRDEVMKRILAGRVPYVRLTRPTRDEFRIPLQGLLTALALDMPPGAHGEGEIGGVSPD